MKQLHPRAVWLFFIRYVLIWLVLFFFSGSFLLSFFIEGKAGEPVGFSLVSLLTLLAVIVVSYVWALLSYHFYRYELTEAGFRKEHGVIYKKYVTIPYDRIQNVDIYRGIWARILGLSDLHIQTAGMSSPGRYGAMSEGRLPGLSREEAERLRNELIERTRRSTSSQGL